MRQRPAIFAALAATVIFALGSPSHGQYADRSLDLAESRYQQASREAYQRQRAFDDAAARMSEAGKAYQAALDEQRAAARLLADADVNGPRIADEVRKAEAAVEAERQRVAPQYAPVEAAADEHRRVVDRALANVPEWKTARGGVAAARERYEAVVNERFIALGESEDYLDVLAASWDAEDAAIALRDMPNADTNALVEATQAWMASLDAVERYEADMLDADPAVRAAGEAVAQAEASADAVRERLAQQAGTDPEVQRTATALSAAQAAFEGFAVSLRPLQATLDAKRTELGRIDQVAASARQRLTRVEKELPALQASAAQADEATRRAEADLAAARDIEQRSLQDREAIAADLARAPIYAPEPVYTEPPVVIVDGGTTIYYPPAPPTHHHDHGGGRDHGRDRGYDKDRDRHDGGTRRDDGDRGTRRDEGDRSTRNREGDTPARRDEPVRAPREGTPRQPPQRPDRPEVQPHPKGDDAATARRQQEEAKAAERQRREDAASTAAARQRSEAAARQEREASSRAESSRRQQEESSRQRQQQSEAAAREQRREQERPSQSREPARTEDRGDRYRRR